ncbi:MAG: arginase [Methylococcaceae bacterium]|nr:arginase [Methylococcaceae bacterium]
MANIQTLGIASCLGGPIPSCGYAAEMLRDEFARQGPRQTCLALQWHMLYPEHQRSKEENIAKLDRSISLYTACWTKERLPFLIIGGDHSCAMGTWGGVINGLPQSANFGLIWLDAHMDAHTFATSPSGNVHGMPVAALLGKADDRLAPLYPGCKFIKPENLILIGVRDFENKECDLLKQASVPIVYADQIDDLARVLVAAIDNIGRFCDFMGISIDLDIIDPEDAPGVETPVPGGIRASQLIRALSLIHRHPQVCGLEITEFNPEQDKDNKTLRLMKDIVEAFYGDCE